MNRIQATMNDLPELPFEKVLSYLNLEDRLKARAVSRRWYHKINSFRVESLCYSDRPSGFILGKNRWVSGAFAQNFISSTRFESFFSEYGRSVLSNLKHLRLCDLNLDLENRTAFTRTLKSFGQLEELDIIRARCSQKRTFTLNLPMLTSIHLEDLSGIQKLTLKAPRLRKVKFVTYRYVSSVLLDIVHGESVESLYVWNIARTTQKAVKNLKNLKYLYVLSFRSPVFSVDPTFLSSLEQLKELHLHNINYVEQFFRQKQQYGRANLKIYRAGWLLSGPDDPKIRSCVDIFDPNTVRHLTENPSRLADVIPFHEWIVYDKTYYFPESVINIMSRLANLKSVYVKVPIRDIQNFLDLLKNCENILTVELDGDQPQDLFDRLPEHCAIQKLVIRRPPPVGFLFRLKHLIVLDIGWSIDSETIRKVFEELPFVSSFRFKYLDERVAIESAHPKQFTASVEKERKAGGEKTVFNLNAAIEFLQEFISLSWIGQRPTA